VALVGDISQETLAKGDSNGATTRDTAITLGRDEVGMQSMADDVMSTQDFHGSIEVCLK